MDDDFDPTKPRSTTKNFTFKIGLRQQVVPSGNYLARVIDIKEIENYKRRVLHFFFEIGDGPHRGVVLRGFVNAQYETFTQYTKLHKWYSKVTNDTLEPGDDASLAVFFDKILIIQVSATKASKKTQNLFSNVSDVLGVHMEL